MAKNEKKVPFDPKIFLSTVNGGRGISKYRKNQTVFSQSSCVYRKPKSARNDDEVRRGLGAI
jgi:hypothetical protein